MPEFPPRRSKGRDPPLWKRAENRSSFSVVPGCTVFLSSADGDIGELLSCLKGVKDPFGAQEGKWVFSPDSTAEKCLSSR